MSVSNLQAVASLTAGWRPDLHDPNAAVTLDSNAAWLEIVLTRSRPGRLAKLIGFTEAPELARVEIAAFRYRVLHTAARITPPSPPPAAVHRRHLALGHHHRDRPAPHTSRLP